MRCFFFRVQRSLLLLFLLVTAAAQASIAPQPRIAEYGEPVVGNPWPSTAALLDAARVREVESGALANINPPFERIQPEQANQAALICGAVIVAPQWLLTSASCLKTRNGQPRQAAEILALVQTTDLQQGGQRLTVANVYIHPDFDPQTGQADVGLVELAQPVSEALAAVISETGRGERMTVLGWDGIRGRYTAVPASRNLRQILYRVVESARCTDTGVTVPAGAFCAVQDKLPDFPVQGRICPHDRGGPAFDAWNRAIGIISSSHECIRGAEQSRARFTRIHDYLDWIQSLTGPLPGANAPLRVSLQRQDCVSAKRGQPGALVADDCLLVGGSPTVFILKGIAGSRGVVDSYKFDFGDGTAQQKGTLGILTVTLKHSYSQPGEYMVVAHINDNTGATAEKRVKVTIGQWQPMRLEKPVITVNALGDDRYEFKVSVGGTTGNSRYCELNPGDCTGSISIDYGDGGSGSVESGLPVDGPSGFPLTARFVHIYRIPPRHYTVQVKAEASSLGGYFKSKGVHPRASATTDLDIPSGDSNPPSGNEDHHHSKGGALGALLVFLLLLLKSLFSFF